MSKLCWILISLSLTVTVSAVAGAERGALVVRDIEGQEVGLYAKSYALLVGVSEYANGWPRLPGVKDDLTAVEQALAPHGFEVRLVRDPADKDALEAAFEDFVIEFGQEPHNRLLFYFAGHGHTDKPYWASNDKEQWTGYIVARDAPPPERDRAGFLRNAVSMKRFEELSEQIQSKHALFLFDSCFSGSVFALSRARPTSISYKTAEPVRQFITSGEADETVPDTSVFRRQLEAALLGEADGNADRYITGAELGEYLQDRVINYTRGAQHPQYGKIRNARLDKGDFVFALKRKPRPHRTPPPAYLGNLQIHVNVPAKVHIGDGMVGETQPGDPLNRSEVPVGRTEVRVEAEGHESQTRFVQVQRGQWEQLFFELKPIEQAVRLTVRSNVFGDTVYINGEAMGSTRLDQELPPGHYQIRVEKEGYRPWEDTVALSDGEAITLYARLELREPNPGETWTEPVTGMQFAWIPEGCFQMGSEQGDEDELPLHEVCVKGFWLGKHEVTQGQWIQVMAENPSFYERGLNHPVERVSWDDVQTFIKTLGARGQERFRLPSEAEWEYACRSGGKAQTYCGGNDPEPLAWFSTNSKNTPQSIGRKRANDLGLHDMSGNLWEWVQDCYHDGYGDAPPDGSAWEDGDCAWRVFRGGAWDNYRPALRAASRLRHNPAFSSEDLGFRLVRIP